MVKCFVTPCKNHTHQGEFCGKVCKPCALYAEIIEVSVQDTRCVGITLEVEDFITKNLDNVLVKIKEN